MAAAAGPTFGKAPLAPESVMAPKAHGTCATPVMDGLRWGCDFDTADRICCMCVACCSGGYDACCLP